MTLRQEVRVLALPLAAVWLATPALRAAHQAAETREAACRVCAAMPAAGPALVAECGGACSEPGHHHHAPAHDRDGCAVCRTAAPAVAEPIDPVAPAAVAAAAEPAPRRPRGAALAVRRPSSRAPPRPA